jgi:hypothetical protein
MPRRLPLPRQPMEPPGGGPLAARARPGAAHRQVPARAGPRRLGGGAGLAGGVRRGGAAGGGGGVRGAGEREARGGEGGCRVRVRARPDALQLTVPMPMAHAYGAYAYAYACERGKGISQRGGLCTASPCSDRSAGLRCALRCAVCVAGGAVWAVLAVWATLWWRHRMCRHVAAPHTHTHTHAPVPVRVPGAFRGRRATSSPAARPPGCGCGGRRTDSRCGCWRRCAS